MMTKQYYNLNEKDIYEKTIGIDLQDIYKVFESYLKPGAKLLDIGFGSGRDSLHFNEMRYTVVSIDFAQEVFERGKSLLNNEVLLVDVRDIQYQNEFDAIWASAVLFHFEEEEIRDILKRCQTALKDQGIMYISFKYGEGNMVRKGRFFNNFTEEKFEKLLEGIEGFKLEKMWQTEDARADHKGHFWLNVILEKQS